MSRDNWRNLSVTAIAAENVNVGAYIAQLEHNLLEMESSRDEWREAMARWAGRAEASEKFRDEMFSVLKAFRDNWNSPNYSTRRENLLAVDALIAIAKRQCASPVSGVPGETTQ